MTDGTPVERGTVSLGEFAFERGGSVPDLEVAYEAYGTYTSDNAVLVCHALTGSQRVASLGGDEPIDAPYQPAGGQSDGWWSDVVGPGRAIDTDEYYVVCANVPGSCYGTTGPASVDPRTGEPYGSDFPAVTVGDWTRSQRALLSRLGIDRLHAVVGGSVGGMNVLDWARRYPDAVDVIVPVATAPRLDPQLLAINGVARRAIRSDPNWNGGDYYDQPERPTDGLTMARQLGHVTYLSKASMERKFGRREREQSAADAPFPADSAAEAYPYREVESYLDYQGTRFGERFDPNSYLHLTRAMDDYDLAAGEDSDAAALAGFDGEALVLSVAGDWHFTVEGSEAITDAVRAAGGRVVHHVVDSDHGHDAFLVEPDEIGPPIATVLADGVDGYVAREGNDCRPGRDDDDHAPVHASLFCA